MTNKTILISCLILSFLVCSSAFCAEEFAITAYYPSPAGVYKTFRIYPSTNYCTPGGSCAASQEGELCQDGNPLGTHKFYVCSGSPLAWNDPGYWGPVSSTHPNDIHSLNSGYVKMDSIPIGSLSSNLPAPALGSDGNDIKALTSGTFQVVDPTVTVYKDVLAQNVRAQGIAYSYKSCIPLSHSNLAGSIVTCPPGSTYDSTHSGGVTQTAGSGVFYCCY